MEDRERPLFVLLSSVENAPSQSASQRWCADLLRREAKSFYLATRFLPKAKREAVEAIYGAFRTADDIADEPGPTREERLEGLRAIADALAHVRDDAYSSNAPWFPAVHRAFSRFPIAIGDALRVIEACRSDVDGVTCESLEDLERYSSSVAGTVGRCSIAILGAWDDDSLERAGRLGVALQLTNVIRDVERDHHIGRSYLPRKLATLPDRGRAAIAARAREYYAEARVLARRLPNDGSRLAILLAADFYEGMIDGSLSLWERLRRAARCMRKAYVGM